MKSLGDTLRSAREERGISMDQVIHETNISRNYLEALENEAFDDFPAEAYLVGFLRNYAEFLGLDADKVVGQFRNYKLSEEPTPIEQLVGPPKGAAFRKVFPWIVLVIVLAAAGFFGIPGLIKAVSDFRARQEAEAAEARNEEVPPSREIHPSLPLWEGEVRPSDTLVLEDENGELKIDVKNGEGKLEIDAGDAGSWQLMLGEEIYIPGKDGNPAWRLYLKDLGLPGGGSVVEIQQLAKVAADEEEEAVISAPPSGESERKRDVQVLLSSRTPERYTLDIDFRGFCLFRYKVDSQDPLEAYYADGDNFRLDVGRKVTLWSSNAGAIYAKISGKELALGRQGEVAIYQIRWILNEESGLYDLSMVPLY